MPHAPRLASLPPPLQHAAVELLRGTMTKHDFVAYRDDRAGESQPISFGGEGWLSYVPVRLPWTLCVRERLPAGASAVLINRAHPYPDLALPINAAQDRVLTAIDGKRTVSEILRGATETADLDQGREFVERLWRYDLIVFDATGSALKPLAGRHGNSLEGLAPVKEWLILATNVAVDVIDWLALILIVVGAVEAFFRGLWTMFASPRRPPRARRWLRLGRWLVAGLTFQLAADVLETAITTSWDEVARLGGDRRDPHVPQLFSRTRSRRGPAETRLARR